MHDSAQLLLLDRHDVVALLRPDDVIDAVHLAFILHSRGDGRIFPVVREKLASGSIFGIKSGGVEIQGLLGFKAAGFWPENRQSGSEPHQATIMLFDPENGRPTCLIDGNDITAARTAAAGAIGLLQLARHDSTRLCVFGSGVQARSHLAYALRLMPRLQQVLYVTANDRPDAAFEAHFESLFAGALIEARSIEHAADRNAAVSGSDIVITATPGFGPLFDLQAVRPGTHFNCVGTDTRGKRELPEGLLQIARLFVDDQEQAGKIGEAQWAPCVTGTELGDLLSGKTAFQRHAEDITVFDMTGIALQDLTVARMLHEHADAAHAGKRIPWPW